MSAALFWGWYREAAILGLTWCGSLRIGEVLLAVRDDLVLPADSAPGTQFALLLNMNACKYIYIYAYICIYHICICVHTCVCIDINIYIDIYVYIYKYIYMHVPVYICETMDL